jgi:uncharacterized protein YndB with AHSA1/START domain
MATLTRSITINAPVKKVFDFAKDVGKLWACFEDCAVRDVELKPEGVGSSARWFSHMLGIHMEGVIEYTEVVPNQRIVGKSSTGPIWKFTFEPEDGGTKLTVDCEWHLAVPVVGVPVEALIMKLSENQIETTTANIKAQVEEGRVPRSKKKAAKAVVAAPTTLKIHIEAPVEKVFAFWANPANWSQVTQMKYTMKELVITPEGMGTHYTGKVKVAGVPYEVKGHFTEFVLNERIVETESGHLLGTYVYGFEPDGSGMQFTFEHIPAAIGKVPVVGPLFEWQATHIGQKFLEDLKKLMES